MRGAADSRYRRYFAKKSLGQTKLAGRQHGSSPVCYNIDAPQRSHATIAAGARRPALRVMPESFLASHAYHSSSVARFYFRLLGHGFHRICIVRLMINVLIHVYASPDGRRVIELLQPARLSWRHADAI